MHWNLGSGLGPCSALVSGIAWLLDSLQCPGKNNLVSQHPEGQGLAFVCSLCLSQAAEWAAPLEWNGGLPSLGLTSSLGHP